MISTKDIQKFLEDFGFCKTPFQKITKNHKNIKSEEKAYDYDEIKHTYVGVRCESADALYVKKHIYLLEFKTGFASEKTDANTRTHKENLKLRIRLKAYESLALLEKILLPKVGDGELNPKTQKIYIAIVDTQYVPMEAYADVLKLKSGEADTFKEKIFKNTLAIYGKEAEKGKKLFYDRVDVWYDYEFDRKIRSLA